MFNDYQPKIKAFFERFPDDCVLLQGDTYAAPLAKMSQKDIDDFIQLHRELVVRWRESLRQGRT